MEGFKPHVKKSSDDDKKQQKSLKDIMEQALKSSDFHQFSPVEKIVISYYKSLINEEKINQFLIKEIQKNVDTINNLQDIENILPFDQVKITNDTQNVEDKLIKGFVVVQLKNNENDFILVNVSNVQMGHRKNNDTENEFSVVGPKVGFVENIDINIHLLRQQVAVSNLVIEEITIGNVSKTKVAIAYLDGVTNPRQIETVKQRLNDINLDVVYDSSLLDQIISDNSNTIFPLFLSSERIDRITYAISLGQVAVISDGSPYVISGPSTILDYFISPEDYFLPWILGSFFRITRICSVFFSIFATSLYVAVLTYHFEVIPEKLLEPLVISRANVPFPPVMEVIFLEITIELLREAGARLPAKIGQTLGIVGGIVIGQATVEAALTSSILLIIVALSALASFTTPIFKMANTIRVLRFPFIILAAIWGGLGIVAGILFLMGHLLRLKSLGTPYLVPLFPFRTGSFADSIIRSSYKKINMRNKSLKPLSLIRYEPSEDMEDINHEES
jgi:spore germination protein KA